jgi:hypothetical protein
MEWLSKIIKELVSSDVRHVFVIAIFVVACGLVLLPQSVAEILGVDSLRTAQRQWIGLAVLAPPSLYVAELAIWGFKQLKAKWGLHQNQAMLHKLTSEECSVLRPYIENQTQTAVFSSPKGVIYGLVKKNILYPAFDHAGGYNYYYNMNPWAYEYLSKHPELLS